MSPRPHRRRRAHDLAPGDFVVNVTHVRAAILPMRAAGVLLTAGTGRVIARGDPDVASRTPVLLVCIALSALALSIEAGIGYPPALFARVGHPVSWMGSGIAGLDRRFNRDGDAPGRRRRLGFLALGALLVVTGGTAAAVQIATFALVPEPLALLVLGVIASSCLAQRSLDQHVRAVAEALDQQGLAAARKSVAMIVGRDTTALDEAGVARAAIESLAENFADGIVAPALWIAIAGLPGGIIYKAVNTADSMIGHRTPRHEAYGFAAAKLDDAVNWPAARLAGFWLVLAAGLSRGASAAAAWRVMGRDARKHASPNAGWPEAAMAGALGIRLGGSRTYAGRLVRDAGMGDGSRVIGAKTIRQALRVYRAACALHIVVFALAALWLARS